MANIIVADFRVTGNEHLMINAAVIEGLKEEGWNISLAASKSHLDALGSCIDLSSINQIPMSETYYENRFKTLYFREILIVKKIIMLYKLKENINADQLLITTMTPLGHIFLKLFEKIGMVKNCTAIVHAELEHLNKNKKITFTKLAMLVWRQMHNLSESKIKYICLNDHIIKNMASVGLSKKRFISAFHPFPRKYIGNNIKKTLNRTLTIIVPGLIRSDTKAIGEVFRLEEILLEDILQKKIQIKMIGRVHKNTKIPENTTVQIPYLNTSKPIPQNIFDAELRHADFIFLPYTNKSYYLTASGAIFDALKYRTPIISFRNDLFSSLMDAGCFPGLIFEDLEKMAKHISDCTEWHSASNMTGVFTIEMENNFERLKNKSDPKLFIKKVFE